MAASTLWFSKKALYHITEHDDLILDRKARNVLNWLRTLLGRSSIGHHTDPTVAATALNVGLTHANKNQWSKAATAFRSATRHDPSVADAHHNLSLALSNLGDTEGAFASALEAARIAPNRITLLNLGNTALRVGDFESSETAFRNILVIDPEDSDVLANLGILFCQSNNWPLAIEHLTHALRISPNNTSWMLPLSTAYRQDGQLNAGLKTIKQYLIDNPSSAAGHIEYARILKENGDWEQAKQPIHAALELKPSDTSARHLLAESLYNTDQYDDATVELNSLIAENPRDKGARFLLAAIYQQVGEFDSAKTLLEDHIKVAPQDSAAYVRYAVLLTDSADYTQARKAFSTALEIEPNNIFAYVGLGKLLYELREYDQACELLSHAHDLSPETSQCTFYLALSCLAAGKIALGYDYYSKQSASGMRNALNWTDPHRTEPALSPAGKRVLIRREQGLGDELRFAGCFEDAITEASSCIIQCDTRLAPIFQRSFPSAEIYPVAPIDCPHDLPPSDTYDMVYLAGDLPARYRRTIDAFPSRRSTLVVNPDYTAIWKARLSALGPGIKIGVCWRSEQVDWFRMRNTFYSHIEDWGNILNCPGATFVNLYYGECEQELQQAERAHGVRIHRWSDLNLRDDLENVFALISELDLVITAQTAVWNMAGAAGTETWATLNPIMRLGTDSIPWYTCVDPIPYDVGDTADMVLARIAARLRIRVGQDGPAH